MIRKLSLFLILLIQVSCSEGDLFGPKKQPLPGQRLNVLHYDLMKENIPSRMDINIPTQENITAWNISDIGQYTGLPYNISLSDKLDTKTQFSLPNFNKSQGSAILIIEDIIYTYSYNILSAYDSKNKKTLWTKTVVAGNHKSDIISGSMTFHNNIIYLASGTPDLIALDATNGQELWRYTTANVVRYISLVQQDKLYLSGTDNTLSCIDLKGNLLWKYDAPIYSLVSNRIYEPNIVYQDKVVNITTAGDLIVLNKYDGLELTQVNLANSSIIGDGSLEKGPLASPYLDKDFLYILNGEHEFIKIDLANPQIVWSQNFPNSKSFWVADNVTYLITRADNQLIAINNLDGKVIWIVDLDEKQKSKSLEYYGPIMAGDKVIVSSREGEIIMYSSKDGSEINRLKSSSSTHQMPMVVNNKLYSIGNSGNITVWQ